MDIFCFSFLGTRLLQIRKRIIKDSHADSIEVFSSRVDSGTLVNSVKNILERVPYHPSPYACFDYHGQLQTFLQFNRRNIFRLLKTYIFWPWSIRYDRQKVLLPDGGTIALDWARYSCGGEADRHIVEDPTAPIVVLLHGLVGDSHSEYIVHFVEKLLEAGFRPVVMVKRGCGGLALTNPQIFAGRRTGDIACAIEAVKQRYPIAKIFWVGYSLGAALSLQYLSEHAQGTSTSTSTTNISSSDSEKGHSGITAAVCVSPPWDIATNVMFPSLIPSMWTFLLAIPLKLHFLQHFWYLRRAAPEQFDVGCLLRVLCGGTMAQFDSSLFSSYFNPAGKPYATVSEYYEDISPSRDELHRISTPTLALSAKDDPLCMHTHCPTDPDRLGPGLVVVKTQYGGHLAFPEGVLPLTRAWADDLAIEWFRKFLTS